MGLGAFGLGRRVLENKDLVKENVSDFLNAVSKKQGQITSALQASSKDGSEEPRQQQPSVSPPYPLMVIHFHKVNRWRPRRHVRREGKILKSWIQSKNIHVDINLNKRSTKIEKRHKQLRDGTDEEAQQIFLTTILKAKPAQWDEKTKTLHTDIGPINLPKNQYDIAHSRVHGELVYPH